MIFSLLPILVLIVVLMLMKRPAWQAALAAYAVVIVETLVQGMPAESLASASLNGIRTGLFPIGLVIIAALFVYNVVCESRQIDIIKSGLAAFSPDMRFAALMVAWGFGTFMEGMAGFGTAVAIPRAILVGIGMDPYKAVLCCLVANTTPTAFGSVGVSSMVLASEAEVDILPLSRCIASLEFFVTALSPFLILLICDGWRGIREKWGLALLADIAFLLPWTLTAFTLGCELPDIIGGICVMLTLGLCGNHSGFKAEEQVKAWSPFIAVVSLLGLSSAAANIMGAGIGKMICPQSIVLGCAAASLSGSESRILARALRFFVPVLLVASVITYLAASMGI